MHAANVLRCPMIPVHHAEHVLLMRPMCMACRPGFLASNALPPGSRLAHTQRLSPLRATAGTGKRDDAMARSFGSSDIPASHRHRVRAMPVELLRNQWSSFSTSNSY